MQALYSYGSTSKSPPPPTHGRTEFEILKASHKFLRDDEDNKHQLSWDEQLASKYYTSLYREFAVCDLKHYKSGNFALRWRTESEVLSGAGETTCGNTRCQHHELPRRLPPDFLPPNPTLSTLELPFIYAEHGESKSALVKVVLCDRCVKKLMWKRRKEKEKEIVKGKGKDSEQGKEEQKEQKEQKQLLLVDVDVGDVAVATTMSENGTAAGPESQRKGKRSVNDTRARSAEDREAQKGWNRKREGDGPTADDAKKRARRRSRSLSPRSRVINPIPGPPRRTSEHRSSS